jgi:ferredoxin/flavodoxin---NADP+ reductase
MPKNIKSEVTWRQDLTDDLWLLRVRPEEPVRFKAGQFVLLGLRVDDFLNERAYSICSSAHSDELEFFLERVDGGALSPSLYTRKVGDEVLLRPAAKGRFTLEAQKEKKRFLLVATVTGVAPYVSMARTLRDDFREGAAPEGLELAILHGGSRATELGYRAELEEIAREVPFIRYVPTVSRPWLDPEWKGETGRCDELLRKYLDVFQMTPADTVAYLCGHPGMIENAKGVLKRARFPTNAVYEEKYWRPIAGKAGGEGSHATSAEASSDLDV